MPQKTSIRRIWFVCALSFLFLGCPTFTTYSYSPALRKALPAGIRTNRKVTIGNFAANGFDYKAMRCRGLVFITCPDDMTFADYIRNAFIAELKAARLYAPKAPVALTVNLKNVDFSSLTGEWVLDAAVTSSNGKSISVQDTFPFDANLIGVSSCSHAAQSFRPAVQKFITGIIRHKDFPSLVRPHP